MQTLLERIVIGVYFNQVAGLELATSCKIEGSVQEFCCEFCEVSQKNIMQNDDCSWTLRGVTESKYSRNLKIIIEITAKALRNKCSGNRV